MKQLELFGKHEDMQYALSLSMDDFRSMNRRKPSSCKYFYQLRHEWIDRIRYSVARATFIAKFDDSEFSRLKR